MDETHDKYDIPEPPMGLEGKIMRQIAGYEWRMLLLKTTGFGALFLASVLLLVVGYLNLVSALSQSGFFQFSSLLFSDFNVAMENFQDFAFSMLESFPVFSAAFLVGGLVAVIWSASHFIKDISEVRTRRNLSMGV